MGASMTNNQIRSFVVPLLTAVVLATLGVLIAVFLGVAWG
jgi:hypothetical protein